MNREEFVAMLKKADVWVAGQEPYTSQIIEFTVLLADYCAGICESRYMGDDNRERMECREDLEAKRCADAIRAKFKELHKGSYLRNDTETDCRGVLAGCITKKTHD